MSTPDLIVCVGPADDPGCPDKAATTPDRTAGWTVSLPLELVWCPRCRATIHNRQAAAVQVGAAR